MDAGIESNGVFDQGAGEDAENTTVRLLWDLHDAQNEAGDTFSLPVAEIFAMLSGDSIQTINELYSSLTLSANFNERTRVGALLELHNVAPRPVGIVVDHLESPVDQIPQNPVRLPLIVWEIPQGNANFGDPAYPPVEDLLDRFTVLFFDGIGNFLLSIADLNMNDLLDATVGDGDEIVALELSQEVWDFLRATPGQKSFVVTGGWADGSTGMYWSNKYSFEILA